MLCYGTMLRSPIDVTTCAMMGLGFPSIKPHGLLRFGVMTESPYIDTTCAMWASDGCYPIFIYPLIYLSTPSPHRIIKKNILYEIKHLS